MRRTFVKGPAMPASVVVFSIFLSLSLSAREQTFELTLGGLTFDPLTDFPALDSGRLHETDTGPNFRLIQFQGPIQKEWLRDARGQGVEIIQYIHPYTYVVWADQAQLAAARSKSGVRWSGEFAAEFRVLPHQRGRDATVVPTMALVSRHVDEAAVRARMEAAGAVVHRFTPVTVHTSVVYLEVAGDRYMDLGNIPAVYTVQYIAPETAPRGEMSNQSIVGNYGDPPGHTLFPGYVDWLSDTGYDGSGVTVGIVDGGIRISHQDLADRIVPCVASGDSPTSCSTSNNSHGTHVAGAVAGTGASGVTDSGGFLRGQGVAPGANLVQQRYGNFTGAGPGGMIPDGMLKIYRESALSGTTHTNNSWGPTASPQGYDIPTQQIDIITRDATPDIAGNQGVLPVWSIMNGNGDSGGACSPSSLGSPDEAKNLFGIGSTKMQPSAGNQYPDIFNVSSNSAHGPACDGRTGLHIVAPGCSTDSTDSGSDTDYGLKCGTSMASPVVSGAVAVFIERYRDLEGADPSPAMIKAAITAVATNLHGFENADGGTITETPSRFQGYGRLDLDATVNPPNNVFYFDQQEIFTNSGQEWTTSLAPEDPTEPVRLMLMWTDAPGHGNGGTTPAWVNDLDLVVEADSDTYLGNVIGNAGFSETGGTADEKNNAEAVFLRPDQHNGGSVGITVAAINIAGDALNPHDPGDPSQDFALVCYNCIQGDPRTVGGEVQGLAGGGLILQNNGNDDLEITEDGSFTFAAPMFDGQDYAVTVAAQPAAPDQECEVENGEGAIGGADITDVLVTCETLAVLTATPPAIDFGELNVGDTLSLDFEIENTAPAPARVLELTSVEVTGGETEFAVTGGDCSAGTMLEPGENCTVEITFGAEAVGAFNGTVTIASLDGQVETIDLSGTADQDSAGLGVTPGSLDFGGVILGDTGTAVVTISNVADEGAAELELTQIEILVGQDQFSVDEGGSDCGETLAPQQSCTVEIHFTPDAEAAYSGLLRIVANGKPNENVTLSGNGIESALAIFEDRFESQ